MTGKYVLKALATLKEFGEQTEADEVSFVTTRIKDMSGVEVAKYLDNREEYFEDKLGNIDISDEASQVIIDKQSVSTRLWDAIRKDYNLDTDSKVRTDTKLSPKQIGDNFYVHFDYMADNEAREEEIKTVLWDVNESEWVYSNTECSTVAEIFESADTYSTSSLDEEAEKIFKGEEISSILKDEKVEISKSCSPKI